MTNKITSFLSKKSGKQVTNMQLLNTIRDMADNHYKDNIPYFNEKLSINHNTVPYTVFATDSIANQFFNILIDKIGTTVIRALDFENPFSAFKSETFEHGRTLEEIYVGLAEAEQFDAKSTTSPFKISDTDIKVMYHDINREVVYTRTMDKQWAIKAFTSDKAFDEFIDKMFVSLMSSDQLDEFEAVKKAITNSMAEVALSGGGTITVPSTEIDKLQPDFIITLQKELIERSNNFALPSRTRFENAAGVPKATPKANQFLILRSDIASEFDSLHANAFNLSKLEVVDRKIVVDDFPVFNGAGKHNGKKPMAVLLSVDSLILKDKLLQLNNIFNPRNLNYNYFLHHHQLVSVSLFENMHVYYE